MSSVEAALTFLMGEFDDVLKRLSDTVDTLSEKLEFERAQIAHERLESIRSFCAEVLKANNQESQLTGIYALKSGNGDLAHLYYLYKGTVVTVAPQPQSSNDLQACLRLAEDVPHLFRLRKAIRLSRNAAIVSSWFDRNAGDQTKLIPYEAASSYLLSLSSGDRHS
jgi:hypothetical protein